MDHSEQVITDSSSVRTGTMLLILAVGVGAACGYAALSLLWLIEVVQVNFFGPGHGHLYSGAARLDSLRVLLAPVLGGLLVGLFVRFVVTEQRNHGPEDVMQAVREDNNTLTLRAGLSSALASALAIGCGASLGRYGPSVHLGASIAAWVGQRFKSLRAERHILIGCGVAAAISASFNAPLAGVMLGSALGQSLQLLDSGLVSSLPIYAIAGMGAVASCVIGAPITTILIVFELTGCYALTSAVMIAVVSAHLTTSRIYPLSWFNLQLLQRGVDLYQGRAVRIMRLRQVAELLADSQLTVAPQQDILSVREALLRLDVTEALMCDESGTLRGQISLADVVRAVDSGRADAAVAELAVMPGIVLARDENLDAAMKQLRYFKGASVPVVDSIQDMRPVGVIDQSSIIGAYGDAVSQAHEEEHGRG